MNMVMVIILCGFMVVAGVVLGYLMYFYKAKRKQIVEVGDVWFRGSSNPFEKPSDVKVLAVSGEWVQYQFLDFPASSPASNRMDSFLRLYAKKND